MKKVLSAIDLFSGAGGMSFGFSQAGFEIPFAVEKDLWASETYSLNHPKTKLVTKNICDMADSEFAPYRGIDVVVGGPPCQGFSISASSRRRVDDPRNLLYLEFLRVVSIVLPKVVLIENVREITRFKLPDGRLLCDDIKDRLAELGYAAEVLTLNASLFGVPQARIRAFVVACRSQDSLNRAVANLLAMNKPGSDLLSADRNLPISLWEAISDLPEVQPWKVAEDAILRYAVAPRNQYQRYLRDTSKTVINHVPMRHTPRMIERFQHLISNSDLHVSTLPDGLTPRTRGNPEISSGKTYDQNHRRLDPLKPSPTITASFYSSFIHPYQPRNLTVREAARLQGFPDSFVFMGKRTTLSKKLLTRKGEFGDLYLDQFNQVGNSVPPILAKALAEQIRMMICK
jgi:DNA (cytosine-5)-methyltransferase 1